jgi:hypothetical protein
MADKAFHNDCAIKLIGNQKKKIIDTSAMSKKITDQFDNKKEEKEPLNLRGEDV